MQRPLRLLLACCFALAHNIALASGDPVISSHPRLLLTSTQKTRLLARVSANDAAWQALKARADTLASYSINPYSCDGRSDEPSNTIFYDYEGEGWWGAAMPLALAYQMTGDTKYSNKLAELGAEMIRSENDSSTPAGCLPLEVDHYYPTRNLGYTLAIIYDWTYDQLTATQKVQIVNLMNNYFDDMRANAYQINDHADGNYMQGHLLLAAALGYASYGDNSRAQEMIDFARIRFDGTPSSLLSADEIPTEHFSELFEGGYPPEVARDYNGPNITAAPFKGGFDFQGWAYGSGTYYRIIDYLLMVKSATGEDLLSVHRSWFSQILRGMKHALFPNRFEIDPTGDWGGDQGAVIPRVVPARLAYILAGTDDGPYAQHFAYSEIANSTIPGVTVYPLSEWEDFFFTIPTRPSMMLIEPPYYSAFGPVYPQAGPTNGAIPYFVMRSGWEPSATWGSIRMGAAWYDDHQHYDAGSLNIFRGNDYLLVNASNWKGGAGSSGILGGSTEASRSGATNTLWFDDFGEYMWTDSQYVGGQAAWGWDQVVAAEQNARHTYVRSDLTTAYNRAADPADAVNRRLDFFYRSLLYFRPGNVFVVFDQVRAKPSTNPAQPYEKHLRWHFPNIPTIEGRRVVMDLAPRACWSIPCSLRTPASRPSMSPTILTRGTTGRRTAALGGWKCAIRAIPCLSLSSPSFSPAPSPHRRWSLLASSRTTRKCLGHGSICREG